MWIIVSPTVNLNNLSSPRDVDLLSNFMSEGRFVFEFIDADNNTSYSSQEKYDEHNTTDDLVPFGDGFNFELVFRILVFRGIG